ncbi:hypothetical protein JCM8097_007929 [Rhodosporidiobolus ruineniae]
MSSSASPTPPPPRASLSSLPTELKKRIVELVAQQDEVLREWTTAIRPKVEAKLQDALDDVVERYGSSLGALFCVSKEFAKLAAPYRFQATAHLQVFKATHADLCFQAYVSAHRVPLFKRIELDCDDKEALNTAIAALVRVSQLDSLSLHHKALNAITYPFHIKPSNLGTGSTHWSMLRQCLRRIAPSLRRLELHSFNGTELSHLIEAAGSTVKALSLHLVASYTKQGVDQLAKKLVKAKNLRELHVEAERPERILPLSALTASLRLSGLSRCSLRELSLVGPFLTSSSLAFCALFAGSLEKLSLNLSTPSPDTAAPENWTAPRFENEVFPLVRRLNISGEYDALETTVPSLRQKQFPVLEYLCIEISDLGLSAHEDGEPLCSILAHLRHIHTLRLHDGRPPCPADSNRLTRACAERGITFLPGPEHLALPAYPFFHGEDNLHSTSSGNETACLPFVETLSDFLINEIKRAKQNEDGEGLQRLAGQLKELEVERLARIG